MKTISKWFTEIIRWIQNPGNLGHDDGFVFPPILQTKPSNVKMSGSHSGTLIVIDDLERCLIVNVNFSWSILRETQFLQNESETSPSFPSIMSGNELSLCGAAGC